MGHMKFEHATLWKRLEKNNIELKQALVTAVVPASKHIVLDLMKL
jgi:hypothetical protein